MAPLFSLFSFILLVLVFVLVNPPKGDVPAKVDAPKVDADQLSVEKVGKGGGGARQAGAYAQFDQIDENGQNGGRKGVWERIWDGGGSVVGFVWTMVAAGRHSSKTLNPKLQMQHRGRLTFCFMYQHCHFFANFAARQRSTLHPT